jgi:enoyl-CoA hydratase/carnithine racemase
MSDFVIYDQSDRIVTLTLNRPDERNAIGSLEFCAALADAVQRANADTRVSCVIVTGAGSAFCAGGNVKTMLKTGGIGLAENPAATLAHESTDHREAGNAVLEKRLPAFTGA